MGQPHFTPLNRLITVDYPETLDHYAAVPRLLTSNLPNDTYTNVSREGGPTEAQW